jgi:hypothetical protein
MRILFIGAWGDGSYEGLRGEARDRAVRRSRSVAAGAASESVPSLLIGDMGGFRLPCAVLPSLQRISSRKTPSLRMIPLQAHAKTS